jgi:uncharacterized protein involved in outer membrane biogenesis
VLSKRWFGILLVLLALGAGLLAGTPLVIRHCATQWLHEHGGDQVRFEDVDFNPFTGTLLLKGLLVAVNDETTLSFDSVGATLAWLPLLRKQVDIQAVELNGFQIVVDERTDNQLLIGGLKLPESSPDNTASQQTKSTWAAGLKTLSLHNVQLRYRDARLDVQLVLDHLALGGLSQWSAETPTQLDASGSVNGAPFKLSGHIAPLAANPRYELKLALQDLPLDAFSRLLADQLQRLSGQLSYDGALTYAQAADGYRVDQQGTTRLQSLAVAAKRPHIELSNADAAINSTLTLASGDSGLQLQLATDAQLTDLAVSAPDSHLQLLRSSKLKLTGLDMAAVDRLSIGSVTAEKLELARNENEADKGPYMDVDRFEVSSLALADRLLSIDSVHYVGGHNHMQRDAEGKWRIIGIIDSMKELTAAPHTQASTAAPAGTPAADDSSAPAPLAVAIGRIEVSGDSSISLLDESVQPPFETRLDIDSWLVESLDTRNAEQKSPIKLAAHIGKYTRLSVQGDVQPFAQPIGTDLKATIYAMDLPPLSPYTRSSLGLLLDSGTLDADTTLKMDKTQMAGLVKLNLHQLELENVESKHSLQSQIPVPLNVALDTLRDSNNTISLKIPIKGDPANPQFNVNDALTKALAGGVQKGALTYLTFALQPYGALITAAKYAGEAINKVRLKPVEFDPGQTAIDDQDKDYLSKIAKLLGDRPKLAIKLCGVATEQDSAFLQQQAAAAQKPAAKPTEKPAPVTISAEALRKLAEARAESVKGYLIETFKTPADHLVGCQPRIENGGDKQSKPRTDLLI